VRNRDLDAGLGLEGLHVSLDMAVAISPTPGQQVQLLVLRLSRGSDGDQRRSQYQRAFHHNSVVPCWMHTQTGSRARASSGCQPIRIVWPGVSFTWPRVLRYFMTKSSCPATLRRARRMSPI